MAAVTVCEHIEQHRASFFFNYFAFTFVGIDHGQRVVTIHPFGMHLLTVHAGTDAGRNAVTHGLTHGLAAHAILVVHDVDDHRQSSVHLSFPEFGELVHRGKVDSLPYRAASQGGVADVGHHQSRFAVHLLVECCTHGYVARSAHDGIVGIDTEGGEEGVHGAAEPSVESGLAGKDLRQRTVYQKAFGQLLDRPVEIFLHDINNRAVEESLHDFGELRIIQLVDGRHTLGQDLTM